MKRILFTAIAVVCGAATLFFAVFGGVAIYTSLTFEGEGSLGRVGIYLAAGVFPLLAFLFGGFTYLAWRYAGAREPSM